ncbi:MAG TPA: ATP-binding protein [Pyrinomonadaceae bacterium]|nr:ATP-binding protein [Pyrinomonadaceae bacterium]
MLRPITVGKEKRSRPLIGDGNPSSAELKFIADLGRSLLVTVHPKKVASRVADTVRIGSRAAICAFVAELRNIGLVSCAFDASGELEATFLIRKQFERWLDFLPPQIGYGIEDENEFLLSGTEHGFEYISPLHINGEIKGAIITGFESKADLTEQGERLIDASTQLAAMSINLTAHYESTIDTSITRAREEHRKFTESILDALPVSLYVVDRDFRIVTWNRHREVGHKGIPRDTAIGRDVFEVLARYPQGRLRGEFERAFETGKIERIEQQTVDEKGQTRHWLVSKVPMRDQGNGEVTHVITVGEDITARVEAIHAIGRAEKLAAVGRLAAGVVHEINNPLATIAACAEALEARVEEGAFVNTDAVDDLNEYLGLIKSEAFRCKSITTGLLDFSRMRTIDRRPLNVAETLQSSANLLSHQKRGVGIDIKVDVKETLQTVNADGGQIQQAVIALGTNAIDAMPNGGNLTLRAFNQANSVVVEIVDTGIGIAAENLSKIFEPFFTTKEVGRGTGLGLAVCYGIVTDHGGRLSVRSSLGVGTTFSILLPASIEQD